jgi:GNAT superfamily N-acetyltransferase
MQSEYSLIEGGPELLDRVEPLWLQLRRHHADLAPIWQPGLMATGFEDRRAKLLSKANQGMLVLLASMRGSNVGYCVSTIDDASGEVDSVFVIPASRGHGIGHAMMSRSLVWFEEKAVHSIAVDIISGNNAAEQFYARYGFRLRTLRMLKTNH